MLQSVAVDPLDRVPQDHLEAVTAQGHFEPIDQDFDQEYGGSQAELGEVPAFPRDRRRHFDVAEKRPGLGLLTTPLRDRFGIPTRLEFYSEDELDLIVTRGARLLGVPADPEGTREIAKRARGTPRIAGRLLRRVVDFALIEGNGRLTRAIADRALTRLGVDALGLDGADRRYMMLMADHYGGGPVGVETLSAALSEARDAIEEVIEPYLLQQGLISRTPRGRMLGARAWRHLGNTTPLLAAFKSGSSFLSSAQ